MAKKTSNQIGIGKNGVTKTSALISSVGYPSHMDGWINPDKDQLMRKAGYQTATEIKALHVRTNTSSIQ